MAAIKNTERMEEYVQYMLDSAKQRPRELLESRQPGSGPSGSGSSSSKGKSIQDKMAEIHMEECEKQEEDSPFDHSSHLLAKLMKKERLNCLVLNLHPGNEGYSLMLKSKSGAEMDTIKLPYEETDLLEYIDAGQLPPFLLEPLEKAHINVFYSSNVIVEVRDFRRSSSGAHIQYVLLKPSAQSIQCDINAMTNDGQVWTQEDKVELERQLLLHVSEPLCLDPSPAVFFIQNRLRHRQGYLDTPSLRRATRRYSQTTVNKKRKFAEMPAPHPSHLFDFIQNKRNKGSYKSTYPAHQINGGKLLTTPLLLDSPESIDVGKYAKMIDPPSSTTSEKVLFEEYTMEPEGAGDKKMLARVTVTHDPTLDEFYGELFVNHEPEKGKGASYQFTYKSKDEIRKYLEQFKELFTEEGRRHVKITIRRPNQQPQVIYPQTTAQMTSTNVTITSSRVLVKPTSTTVTAAPQMETAASEATTTVAGKRTGPIQLSLSIGPSGSLTSASAVSSAAKNPQPNVAPGCAVATPVPQTAPISSVAMATHPRFKGILNRTSSCPSPMTTVVTTPVQHVTLTTAPNTGTTSLPPPSHTPTPPPPITRTPTPTTTAPSAVRRGSAPDAALLAQASQQQQQVQQQQVQQPQQAPVTFIQGGSGQGGGLANINIASPLIMQGLASLQGVNLIAGMPVGGNLMPLTVISSSPSLLPSPGILVSSITSSDTATSTTQQVTSPPLVSMVTGQPSTNASACTTTTGTHVTLPSALAAGGAAVLGGQSGMVPMPVNLSGFVSVGGAKAGQGATLRGQQPVPVLQLSGGQQSFLLNLPQQQRSQLKPATQAAGTRQVTITSPPFSTVITPAMTVGKHLMQLTGQAGGQMAGAQLAFQKATGGQGAAGQGAAGQGAGQPQQFQLHSMAIKPGITLTSAATPASASIPTAQVTQAPAPSRSKSKKRTTPTPPK